MLARTLRQVAASCLLTVAASLAVACIWRVQQTSKLPSDVVLAPKGEDWYESQVKLAKAGLIPSSEVPLEPEAERRRRRQRREHRERGRNNGRHNSDALGFLSVRADAVGQARRVRARLHDASSSQNAGSHSVARLLPGGRGLDALQHAERKWERSHEGHTQIAYSGIVPYLQRKSSRPRAVNCLGALSVSCIADATIKSLQGAPPPPSLGRKAVEQAAKGRGFAPWPTAAGESPSEIARAKALVQAAAHGSDRGSPFTVIRRLYDRLDRRIDGVPPRARQNGGGAPALNVKGVPTPALRAAEQKLAGEVDALKRALAERKDKEGGKTAVAKAARSTDGFMSWLGIGDAKVKATAWGY